MALMKAHVEIGAKLEPLRRGLAKAKAAVAKAVASMQAAFQKMVSVGKKAFIGLAAVMGVSAWAAIKQEKAEHMLSAALRVTGDYTSDLVKKYKEFAAQIQRTTVYGDEEVLMLMQLMKSLGVTTDALELAAKQSIGMAAATGRDIQSMSMYIALAQQGEFTMLRRYIPALRATTDETEQLAIITQFAAEGFKIAQFEAGNTAGALKQMKNAVGDVLEVIGKPFLDNITKTAHGIRDWSIANQKAIGRIAADFDRLIEVGIKVISQFATPLLKKLGELTKKFSGFVTEAKLENVIWAIGEWADKIWGRVQILYNAIKELWGKEELGQVIGDAFKYALDRVTAQFEQWGTQLKIILSGIADIVGHEFSRKFGERVGRGLIDIADKISSVSTLVLVPLQKAMYMAGAKILEKGLEPGQPSMKGVMRRAGAVPLRPVSTPTGVNLLISNISNLIDDMDNKHKRNGNNLGGKKLCED